MLPPLFCQIFLLQLLIFNTFCAQYNRLFKPVHQRGVLPTLKKHAALGGGMAGFETEVSECYHQDGMPPKMISGGNEARVTWNGKHEFPWMVRIVGGCVGRPEESRSL